MGDAHAGLPELFAGWGELIALVYAVEQASAELLFEILQAAEDCGVINAQLLLRKAVECGVTHSEFNASKDQQVRLIQIWLWPDQRDLPPQWAQKNFESVQGLQLIAVSAREAMEGVLPIHQDARFYRLRLSAVEIIALPPAADRQMYLHVLTGAVRIAEHELGSGDAAGFDQAAEIQAVDAIEALVFELPKYKCF